MDDAGVAVVFDDEEDQKAESDVDEVQSGDEDEDEDDAEGGTDVRSGRSLR